jgi:hypothetical protein
VVVLWLRCGQVSEAVAAPYLRSAGLSRLSVVGLGIWRMTSIWLDYTWKERTASVAPWNTQIEMSLEFGRRNLLA